MAVLAVCLVLGVAVSVMAEEKAKPCAADIKKFCANIEPGAGKIMACLDKNKANLSDACKGQLTKMADEAKNLGSPCHDDILQYCGVFKPGKGQILNCLEEQKAIKTGSPYGRLSGECFNKLAEMKKQAK